MVDAETIARACAQAAWPNDRAVRNVGMELVAVGPGSATVKMIVTEAMLNGFEICHGGFIFTLADTAFAVACNTYNERAVAQHSQITFLETARRGDQLVAHAQERVRAKRSGVRRDREPRGLNSNSGVQGPLSRHRRRNHTHHLRLA
jgi:acyl-CoA thioesterase